MTLGNLSAYRILMTRVFAGMDNGSVAIPASGITALLSTHKHTLVYFSYS